MPLLTIIIYQPFDKDLEKGTQKEIPLFLLELTCDEIMIVKVDPELKKIIRRYQKLERIIK